MLRDVSARKVIANVVGLVACAAVGYGVSGLLQLGSCGDVGMPVCRYAGMH